MAGIYIHIPFCKQRCYYCDFFKSTDVSQLSPFLDALSNEISLQRDYLEDDDIETVYFGGGTPSLISSDHLRTVMDDLRKCHRLKDQAEVTIEVNPDDINPSLVESYIKAGVNRVSIGIQSFHDEHLKQLNRRHNSKQAIESVKLCQDKGLSNISLDLIYGIPGMTLEQWSDQLEQFQLLAVPHLSAYHLTIEPNTYFGKQKEKGHLKETDETESLNQYELLCKCLQEKGYEHYEISNFARDGFYSRHNTSYWQQMKYLGLGPSAHSYNMISREWNVSSIGEYIASIMKGVISCKSEFIDETTRFNEYLMTTLRTIWGADLNDIKNRFDDRFFSYLKARLGETQMRNNLQIFDQQIKIRPENWFVSDHIIADLFYSEL